MKKMLSLGFVFVSFVVATEAQCVVEPLFVVDFVEKSVEDNTLRLMRSVREFAWDRLQKYLHGVDVAAPVWSLPEIPALEEGVSSSLQRGRYADVRASRLALEAFFLKMITECKYHNFIPEDSVVSRELADLCVLLADDFNKLAGFEFARNGTISLQSAEYRKTASDLDKIASVILRK